MSTRLDELARTIADLADDEAAVVARALERFGSLRKLVVERKQPDFFVIELTSPPFFSPIPELTVGDKIVPQRSRPL